MAWYFVVITFIASCLILSWLSSRLIKSLIYIARYLQWKEFVITFFVMAFATSLPNFFVAFNSIARGLPEIVLGDIIGGNLADMTLVLAIAVFFSKKGLGANSEMVQTSAVFTSLIAALPILLIWDGRLGRVDGIILILSFLIYAAWVFSKKSNFTKVFNGDTVNHVVDFKKFLYNIFKIVLLLALLLVASHAVVSSAQYFSSKLGISLALTAILIIGLGNVFPEAYFSIVSARKKENWMVLGELMGSVVICATLVLGFVALVYPFEIKDFSAYIGARTFMLLAVIISLVFIKTGKKITKKEGLFLLFIYIAFLVFEVFVNKS